MVRHPSRCTGTLLLLCYLPACTSWQVQNASPQQVLAEKHPSRLRVIRVDGTTADLTQPRITSDTIFGPSARDSARTLIAVPLQDIAHVALRHGDAAKSLILVGGIVVVLVATAAAASNSFEYGLEGSN